MGKVKSGCGFRKAASEITTNGRYLARSNLGGLRGPGPPSPGSQAPAHGQSRPTRARSSAFWGRRAAWRSLSPDRAQPCRLSRPGKKPTHSSSAIFSPIPRSLRDHRARGLAGPAFASGFRWRRGRADRQRGGVSAARGRHFRPFVSMAGGWEDARGRTPGNFQGVAALLLALWPREVPAVPFHRVGTFWGNS